MRYIPLTQDRIADLNGLWNKHLKAAFPMRERLLRQNIFEDPNLLSEGSWIAWEEHSDRAVGCVVAKCWQDAASGFDLGGGRGWIHALIVDSDYRRQGIGGELLAKAEGALQDRGVTRIALGNDLYRRIFPGIPDELDEVKAWFEKRGYAAQGIVHDLANRYDEELAVALPGFEKVTFRVAEPFDRERLQAFMERCFPGGWAYQTKRYWELGGTGREFVVLEREGDGDIIGFCRINDSHSPLLAQNIYWAPLFDGELGGVGPLGIDGQYRGLNYGLAIVQAGIHFLLRRGIRDIVIDCTPYVDFYGKHGYRVWKSYARYEKG